jgi:hypothetical protein
MTSATGVRIGRADLPHEVRSAAEAIVGGAVVEAMSQVGGFSLSAKRSSAGADMRVPVTDRHMGTPSRTVR